MQPVGVFIRDGAAAAILGSADMRFGDGGDGMYPKAGTGWYS